MKVSARFSLLSLALCAGGVSAGTFSYPNTIVVPGAPTETLTISFAGDGDTQDAGIDLNLPANVTASAPAVLVAGSVCGVVDADTIRIVPPSGAGTPLTSTPTAYCSFQLETTLVPPTDVQLIISMDMGAFNDCTGNMNSGPCTFTAGILQIRAGALVGPVVDYTPAPAAALTTVQFPAATTIGGSTNQSIGMAINAGSPGQNGGTTTLDVSTCTTGNANVTVQAADVVCTNGGACADGGDADIDLTCVATSAAQTGTLTCDELRQNEAAPGDGTVTTTPRAWGYTCPAANVAPTLTYNPVPTTNVNIPAMGQVGGGQTANATIPVTAAGGSGTSTSTVSNCAFSGAMNGFVGTAPAGTLTFTGSTGPSPQNLAFSCTAPLNGAGNSTATLTCDQSIGGMVTQVSWPVTCLEGAAVSAPVMAAVNAEDGDDAVDGTAEVTFAAPVGLAGNDQETITLDVSGGQDDGMGAAETIAISGCAITNNAAGNMSIATQPVGTPFGTNDPPMDVDTSIVLQCNGNAAATTGELRCNVTSSVNGVDTVDVRLWELACPQAVTAPEIATTPASPGTINVQGQTGNVVNAQVQFTNTGDADLTVDTCVAMPDSAAITFTPPASPIAINGGTGTLSFACTAPNVGVTETETVTCNTNDTDEPTVTFTLNCQGANLQPIPTVSDLGKVLMAALMIGLGLFGLALRRQNA